MTLSPKIGFTDITIPSEGSVVLIAEDGAVLGASGKALDEKSGDAIAAAAKSARFKAKAASALDLLAPRGLTLSRLLVVGIGKSDNAADWLKAGGAIMGRLQSGGDNSATVIVETASGPVAPHLVAELALGMTLRAYRFDRYKTKKKDEDDKSGPKTVTLAVSDPKAAEAAFGRLLPVAEGVCMARDLVNEPANVLGPVEFADRCEALREAGVEVEILDVPAMEKLGMGALLGVGLGSERPSRLGIMRWNGGGEAQPVAFIGKGVVFDTGGISIKPAGGMEDMKGDMGGAACVVGLMHALAGRKAKVNAVGLVGLVENMPDGKAQRPGDIVTSMSGQTIEIINTDAEGRLVLADVLWYAQDRFKPRFMVNLATLTGAVIVALGHEHAGLFSNDDELSARLTAAGIATGDKVWRLPLAPEYDKMINSKFADMKNTGGRQASSITAAQFLQRFVNDVPWAHLDVAGTAMGSPQTETNRSWASGWGVRLLDRLVAEHYEE